MDPTISPIPSNSSSQLSSQLPALSPGQPGPATTSPNSKSGGSNDSCPSYISSLAEPTATADNSRFSGNLSNDSSKRPKRDRGARRGHDPRLDAKETPAVPGAYQDFIASMLHQTSSKPAVKIKILNDWYTSLVDSGNCFRSCISEEVYAKLPPHLQELVVDPSETATSADSSPLRILGSLKHPLAFSIKGNKRRFHVRFYVLKGLSHSVNLGWGFMKQYNMWLNPLKDTLQFDQSEVPLIGNESDDVCNVILAQDTWLKPESFHLHRCKVTQSHMHRQVGCLEAHPGLLSKTSISTFPVSLATISDTGRVALPLRNPLAVDVFLERGTIIGHFETGQIASAEDVLATLQEHLSLEARLRRAPCSKVLNASNTLAAMAAADSSSASSKPAAPPPKMSRSDIYARLRLDEATAASTPSQKEALLNLCVEFQDIFSFDGTYGHTTLMKHHIPLKPDAQPVKDRWRALNPTLEAELFKQIQSWLRQGVIRKCVSEWSSALVPVRKKSGEIRFCLDVRNLNDRTQKDTTPIGDVNDLLSRLQTSDTFSTLDNVGAYLAVPIARKDQTKTAFATPWGTFCWTRMCFGLATAPSSYARLVHAVLFEKSCHPDLGQLPEGILPYLDDTILHSTGFQSHLALLKSTFEKFRKAKLQLSPDKCELFRKKLKFLGHIVSDKGLEACPEYKKVVMNWPVPNSRKAVRIFFGKVSYYRKFIRDFAAISRPLSEKLKDEGIGDTKPFPITAEFRKSFETLKKALLSSPILSHPDFRPNANPFILDTDFSLEKMQAGATLSQVQGGRERVIAYGSIKLNKAQLGYSSYKGELVSMLIFARKFKYFLQPKKFLFRTDCQALKHMREGELRNPFRQWIETLSHFDFDILHRPRGVHSHVDSLSKIDHAEVDLDCNNFEEEQVLGAIGWQATFDQRVASIEPQASRMESEAERFRDSQRSDETLGEVIDLLSKGEKPSKERRYSASADLQFYFKNWDLLFLDKIGRLQIKRILASKPTQVGHRSILVVPRSSYGPILRGLHQSLGHPGRDKMLEAVNRNFFVFNAKKLVQLVGLQCETCQKTSKQNKPQRGHYFPMSAGFPFQSISIDYVTNLPGTRTGGMTNLFTVKDTFSRWFEAFPCRHANAATAIEKLSKEIFPRFSFVETIHCDNGPSFIAKDFREFCNNLRINLVYSPPYSASSNSVERSHRDLKARLRSALAEAGPDSKHTWLTLLPTVLFIMRTTTNRVTRMSPYEVLFGQAPSTQLSLLFKLPPQTRRELPKEAFEPMHSAQHYARKHIAEFVRRKRCSYQGHLMEYEEGQRVWLFSAKPSTPNSRKLATYWTGPWRIIRKINEVIYEVGSDQRWDYQNTHLVAIDRLMPFIGQSDDLTLHQVPTNEHDLDMEGDEFAEDVEVSRPVEVREGEEPAPGLQPGAAGSDRPPPASEASDQPPPSSAGDSSGPPAPPQPPVHWLDPNNDDLVPHHGYEEVRGNAEAEAEAEAELENYYDEHQLVDHLEEGELADAEDEASEAPEAEASEAGASSQGTLGRPPSAELATPPQRPERDVEARARREARQFLGDEFQSGRKRHAQRPARLRDFVTSMASADSMLVSKVLQCASQELAGFAVGGLYHPRA